MKIFYRLILPLLSVATGLLFLYSAYTKMYPVQSFEYTIREYAHMPALAAAVLARAIIAIEAGLGFLLIFHLYGRRKWPLKAALGLVALFTVYLAVLWATKGDNVNCGCFGDTIWMSPSASILKNIVLIAVTWLLIRYHRGVTHTWGVATAWVILAGVMVLSYVLFPVFKPYKVDLNALYTSDPAFAPRIRLDSGKHIIAFLSQSCSHCRKAATIMHRMKQQNPAIPFFLVIGGTKSDLTDFWKETQAGDIPYTRLAQDPFLKYTGRTFPQIWLVNNSWVEGSLDYPKMTRVALEKWMK